MLLVRGGVDITRNVYKILCADVAGYKNEARYESVSLGAFDIFLARAFFGGILAVIIGVIAQHIYICAVGSMCVMCSFVFLYARMEKKRKETSKK